jgi:hypothetical protein
MESHSGDATQISATSLAPVQKRPHPPLHVMKLFARLLFVVLSLVGLMAASGCTSQRDTSIPWSRPANWEGQVPGMGATPGSGR